MAPKAALAVVLMLCCASAALATYNQCHHDGDCKADNQCVYGVCDYGKCIYKHKKNYTGCHDGNHCTVGDYCWKGDCKPGKPKQCDNPKDTCKTSYCNPKDGQCTVSNKPDGSSCNDGNSCTENDKCTYGACKGTKKVCPKSQCKKSYCNTYSGKCEDQWVPKGTSCSDGNPHTKNDKCNGRGKCIGETYYG